MAHYWQHCSQKKSLGNRIKNVECWSTNSWACQWQESYEVVFITRKHLATASKYAADVPLMYLHLPNGEFSHQSVILKLPKTTLQSLCALWKKSSIHEVSDGLTTVKWKKKPHRVWYCDTNTQWQCCVLKAENEIKIITDFFFFFFDSWKLTSGN